MQANDTVVGDVDDGSIAPVRAATQRKKVAVARPCALVQVCGMSTERFGKSCSERSLKAILSQQNLQKDLIDLEAWVSNGTVNVLIQLASQEAADLCVVHFDGRSWRPDGVATTASCVRGIGNGPANQRPGRRNGRHGPKTGNARASDGRAPWSPGAEMDFAKRAPRTTAKFIAKEASPLMSTTASEDDQDGSQSPSSAVWESTCAVAGRERHSPEESSSFCMDSTQNDEYDHGCVTDDGY